jgi:hypothetical protein
MWRIKTITIKIEYKQRIIKDEYFLLFYYLLNRMIEWNDYFSQSL